MSVVIAVAKALLLLVVGVGLAIPVFAAVFSNASSREDYIMVLAFIAGAYVIAAGIAGLLTRSRMLPLWLTVPAAVLLIWYSTRETQQIVYHGAVFATLGVGTVAGALGGIALRGRHVPVLHMVRIGLGILGFLVLSLALLALFKGVGLIISCLVLAGWFVVRARGVLLRQAQRLQSRVEKRRVSSDT